MAENVKVFSSQAEVADYYDQRFSSHYMDGWDEHIDAKIRTFFSQIDLPSGTYLDFGCGQGALTGLLKSIHPNGTAVNGMAANGMVEGCDVSAIAIQKASEQHPDIPFYVWPRDQLQGNYTLIFSHHVLEHVLNVEETLDALIQLSNKRGYHCHILPCGNEGSLEWQVANATKNGFEENGRFFFEEAGHLRRLSADQLIELYKSRGYRLLLSQFTNQHYGAFKWIIDLGPNFIVKFANPKQGKSFLSYLWLYSLRIQLLLLWQARCLVNHRPKSRLKRLLYPFILPLAKIYVNNFFKHLDQEASNCLSNSQGSEMLMCFAKG